MNRKTLVITALLAAATAHAEKQHPPAPAAPRAFELPAHHDVALDNGAKLTTVAFGSVPKTTIAVIVRGGTASETEQQIWLAELMAAGLREGTRGKTAAQLAEAAAEMGGDLDIQVTPDHLTLTLEVLSEYAPAAIALIADVVRNPAFPEADVARARADLVRRLAISRTNPQQLAEEQFAGALYPGHPYSHVMPTEAMLQGYTVDQVRAFYAAHVGAAATHVYVAGKLDEAAVIRAARTAFAGWARGAEPPPVPVAPIAKPGLRVVDRPGALQSTLVVGLPVIGPSDPDYVALVVTDSLLGGSFGSRITSNIREQKGYTYSPFSSVAAAEGNTSWAERADVTSNVTGASLTEIFKEMARLRAEPPSAAELHGIQSLLAGTFVLRNSTRLGIIAQLAFVERYGVGDDFLRGYVQRVWAVTPAELKRIATRYLDPKQMTLVVVGDRKVVDAQLKPWRR